MIVGRLRPCTQNSEISQHRRIFSVWRALLKYILNSRTLSLKYYPKIYKELSTVKSGAVGRIIVCVVLPTESQIEWNMKYLVEQLIFRAQNFFGWRDRKLCLIIINAIVPLFAGKNFSLGFAEKHWHNSHSGSTTTRINTWQICLEWILHRRYFS